MGKFGLLAISLGVILKFARENRVLSPATLLAMALIVTMMTSNFARGDQAFTNATLILLIVLAAVVVAPRGREAALGFATFGVSVGIASALASVISYETTVGLCERKCGALDLLYFGVFNNENQLGVILVSTLPSVWLVFAGRHRVILSLYIVGLVAVTGNRTSTAVAIAILALCMATRPTFLGSGASGRRPFVLGFAALGFLALSAWLPFSTESNEAFTGRGRLWFRAIAAWEEHPLAGIGFNGWHRIVDGTNLDFLGSYSPHNVWLDVGLGAGLFGICLFLVLLWLIWHYRAPGGGYILGILLSTVFAMGSLEQPLNFRGISSFSFVLPMLLLLVPQRLSLASADSSVQANEPKSHTRPAGRK